MPSWRNKFSGRTKKPRTQGDISRYYGCTYNWIRDNFFETPAEESIIAAVYDNTSFGYDVFWIAYNHEDGIRFAQSSGCGQGCCNAMDSNLGPAYSIPIVSADPIVRSELVAQIRNGIR